MALHHRVALIETLSAEADQKMQARHHALAAQACAQDATPHAGHDTTSHPAGVTLQYEQDWWERACQSLTEVRTMLEDITVSERQRGLSH